MPGADGQYWSRAQRGPAPKRPKVGGLCSRRSAWGDASSAELRAWAAPLPQRARVGPVSSFCIFPLFAGRLSSVCLNRPGGLSGRPAQAEVLSDAEYNRRWAEATDFVKQHWPLLALAAVAARPSGWSALTTFGLQGQPEHDTTGYYLDDHGSHIPVSRAEYENDLAVQDRGFAAVATMFLLVAGVITKAGDPKSGGARKS